MNRELFKAGKLFLDPLTFSGITIPEEDEMDERIKGFERASRERFIGGKGIFEDYINPRSYLVEPFGFFFRSRAGLLLDDTSCYTELLRQIHILSDLPHILDSSQIALIAVQCTVDNYFGQYQGSWEDLYLNHEAVYHQENSYESVSIKQFKDKGIAVCFEKAPIAHNLLVFLGYRSLLVYADECRLEDNEKEKHIYNIFFTDQGPVLYDPTNPTTVAERNGDFAGFLPALYPLRMEDLVAIQDGRSVEVTHQDLVLIKNGFKLQNPRSRIYGS